jgi:hypothetical protein
MASKLLNIDNVCSDIIDGLTYTAIAKKYGTTISNVHEFINKSENSARAIQARQISADSYSDKAELVLKEAESDKNEIQRARELAQHYRWLAGKRNPKVFGDKLDVTSAGEQLPTAINIVLDTGDKSNQ